MYAMKKCPRFRESIFIIPYLGCLVFRNRLSLAALFVLPNC
jgi:hypothetical protein